MELSLFDVMTGTCWPGPLMPVRAMAHLIQQLRADRDQLASRHQQLTHLLEAEKRRSRTDPLTALPNRRLFMDTLNRAVAQSLRDGGSLSVAYLDLDNFKRVNDFYGHTSGDAVLRRVAAILERTTRGADLAARLGGDEFALLFHSCRTDALKAIGRRLVTEIAGVATAYPQSALGVSIGFAYFEQPPCDAAAIVRRADEAMYEAKCLGRNEMVVCTARPRSRQPF
jgi:diguanylate cyclase (GGDEF)-like protein